MVFTMCPGPPWEKMTYMVFGAALTRSWHKGFTNNSVGMIWKGLVGSLQDLDGFGWIWCELEYESGSLWCDFSCMILWLEWRWTNNRLARRCWAKVAAFLKFECSKSQKFKDQERKYSQVHNLSDIFVHMLYKRVLEKFSILFHFSCCIFLRQKKSVQQRASQ